MACGEPPEQTNGHKDVCASPFPFLDECSYECDTGYELPEGGHDQLKCVVLITDANGLPAVDWDKTPTPCKSEYTH